MRWILGVLQTATPMHTTPTLRPHPWLHRLGQRTVGLPGKFAALVPALVVALLGAVWVLDPIPLQVLRHLAFDQYQRWQPRAELAEPVRIVDIDDESLRRLGQWPWPRSVLAQMVGRLQDAGAAAIGLDILLAEPDRHTPHTLLRQPDVPAPVRTWVQTLPDNDQLLTQALARGRVVLGQSVTDDAVLGSTPQPHARFVAAGAQPQPFVPSFAATVPLLPVLEQASAGVGLMTFLADPDGVVRRVPLVVQVAGTLVPSLAAETLRVAQGARNVVVKTDAHAGLAEVRIGALPVPVAPNGESWVYYARAHPARYLPAWQVLEGGAGLEGLQGQMVLVGTSAKGLHDVRFTPLGEPVPGVEVHAQWLDQVLQGQLLQRPAWARSAELAALLGFGLLAGYAGLLLSVAASTAVLLVVLGGMGVGAWVGFAVYGVLLDALVPGVGVVLTVGVASLLRQRAVERRQRWIRQAFSRYFSPNLVDYLVKNPDAIALGGRRQDCSFVFTDLAGFTSTVEAMDPALASTLINGYLDGMIATAFAHEGTLSRIVGDGLVIMFSAPLQQADHQRRALACGWAMRQFSLRYAQDLAARGIAFGQTRVGIHSGVVTVGNFGGNSIMDYRALGDPINTASRLESANRYLGTWICASRATLLGAPEWPVRPIGPVLLKGKATPIEVFEVLDPAQPGGDAAYQAAYDLMAQQPQAAQAAFAALAQERPTDRLVALQWERLQHGNADGVLVLEQK